MANLLVVYLTKESKIIYLRLSFSFSSLLTRGLLFLLVLFLRGTNQVTSHVLVPLLSASLCHTPFLSFWRLKDLCVIVLLISLLFQPVSPHFHTRKGMSLHITFAANKSEPSSEILQEVHPQWSITLYSHDFKICPLSRHSCRQFLCISVAIIMLFSINISRNIITSFSSMTHYRHKARMRKMTPTTPR